MSLDRLPFIIDHDPDAQRAAADAERAMAIAESYLIESPQDAQDAADALAKLRQERRLLDEKRKHLKEPYLEGGRRVDEFFSAPLNRRARAIEILDGAIVAWHRAETKRANEARLAAEAAARAASEQAIARAAAAEAEAEAAARAGNEEAAVRASIDYEVSRHAAESALQDQALVAAAIPMPKVEGAILRSTWKARLTDKRALIQAAASNAHLEGLLQFDAAAANALARATKGSTDVPGIQIYKSTSTASSPDRSGS